MKKISFVLIFVFVLAFGVYAQNEIAGKEKENVINNIIQANPFLGYKGDVLITVN